jgi:hypothetical protein
MPSMDETAKTGAGGFSAESACGTEWRGGTGYLSGKLPGDTRLWILRESRVRMLERKTSADPGAEDADHEKVTPAGIR